MTSFQLMFVIGLGRSGTTLLQGMLNAHPDIVIPPESHFFSRYVVPEYREARLSPMPPDTAAERLKNDRYLSRLRLNLSPLMKPFREGTRPFSYRELYLDLLSAYAQDAPVVGDKSPSYTPWIRELSACYPRARVIHIVRDPRDVLLSRLTTLSLRRRSFFHYLVQNHQVLSDARRIGRAMPPGSYLEVLYEELVQSPEQTLGRLCRALKIPFHEHMLRYHENARDIVTSEEIPWKANVFKPLIPSTVGKWRNGLTPWQIMAVETLNRDVMKDLGYDPSRRHSDLKVRLFSAAARFLVRTGQRRREA